MWKRVLVSVSNFREGSPIANSKLAATLDNAKSYFILRRAASLTF